MSNEVKHTPGPWHVSPPTRENPSRAVVSACSGFVDIYDAPLTHETEANARLIAAAPDLLEALRTIALNGDLCLCEHDDDDCCVEVGEFCAHCIAAVAIAKAETR